MTTTENKNTESSSNYGSIATFLAGSITSTAAIVGTCYIKPEFCISLLNTASTESTSLVTLASNARLILVWQNLQESMINFAKDQLTPTQEQLITTAVSTFISSVENTIDIQGWTAKTTAIDEIIGGSDGHNHGADQTFDEIDLSNIEQDPALSSGKSTPDLVIEEQHNNLEDSFYQESQVMHRGRSYTTDYNGDGEELDIEYQESSDSESINDNQPTTPAGTPVEQETKLDETIEETNPSTDDVVEKSVSQPGSDKSTPDSVIEEQHNKLENPFDQESKETIRETSLTTDNNGDGGELGIKYQESSDNESINDNQPTTPASTPVEQDTKLDDTIEETSSSTDNVVEKSVSFEQQPHLIEDFTQETPVEMSGLNPLRFIIDNNIDNNDY